MSSAGAEELELATLGDYMDSGQRLVLEALSASIRPDPMLWVDGWADRFRKLSKKGSDESGPYRTSRVPYAREVMRALSPGDPCQEVVWMKGGQVGATEVGNNWLGFIIHLAPGPTLIVQPTLDMAKRNSRQRIEPMIEDCLELRARVARPRSRDSENTLLSKAFAGGLLVMTGANSAAALRSFSARYAMTDEEDGYPFDVDEEGDPVALVQVRMRNFFRRKHYRPSSPTIKGLSRIEPAFLRGTQEFYYVPCTRCGAFQVLLWGGSERDYGVKWERGEPEGAWYQCRHCGGRIDNHEKTELLEAGEWRPHNERPAKRVRSFHLSSLYSPVGWFSWGEAATQWQESKGSQQKLKTFINTVLGETYEEKGDVPSDEALMGVRERYALREETPGDETSRELVPERVGLLTAGIDLQVDRFEAQSFGWGLGEECWTYEYDVLPGDPTALPPWSAVLQWIMRPRYLATGGVDYLSSVCIDSGYASQHVYGFVGQRPVLLMPNGRHCFLWSTKGSSGQGRIWPRKASKSNFQNVPVYVIKVDAAKEWVHARCYERLRGQRDGPGAVHFSQARDERYFRQLTSEHCKVKRDAKGYPQRVWELREGRERNEVLDTFVMGYAALCALYSLGVDLSEEVAGAFARFTAPPTSEPVPGGALAEGAAAPLAERVTEPQAQQKKPEQEEQSRGVFGGRGLDDYKRRRW